MIKIVSFLQDTDTLFTFRSNSSSGYFIPTDSLTIFPTYYIY